MKFGFLIILFAFCSLGGMAQATEAEKGFEANRTIYKLEKFAEGEDASSGYDYLVYTNSGEVVKVREIWSSSYQTTFRAEDYFFKDGRLIAFLKYTFSKKHYKSSIKGANIPLRLVEKYSLTDGKLTEWIENGKTVPNTDARWPGAEKDVLERAAGQLETYKRLREEEK